MKTKNNLKIVLAGSPSISCPAFEEIINNFNVVAIVTQSDKPKGRGMELSETEVAKLGNKHQLKVLKCDKIGTLYDELKDLDFDLFVSFAFGQYVPKKILELGKFKPVNIHGSLLPKYRGAAPIHYAVLNGDSEVGITLIEMIDKMDAGDMYFKASEKINNKTTTGEAFEIVSKLAQRNIVEWINKIQRGDVVPEKQSDNFSLSPKIEKDFAEIKNDISIYEAERKIYGLNPFPGAFTFINGKRVKLFSTSNSFIHNAIELKLKDGILYIDEYQFEGKNRIKIG